MILVETVRSEGPKLLQELGEDWGGDLSKPQNLMNIRQKKHTSADLSDFNFTETENLGSPHW